jgi:general secretion pathway protein A
MCHTHYHVKSQPYSEHAPATSLWHDDHMQEGLARLNHLGEHATLGLITGPSGVGKSALLKRFLHELSRQRYEGVDCHLSQLNTTGLLKTIISQLDEQPRWGKKRLFAQTLERAARTECTLLLIVDEAQRRRTTT